MKNRIKKKFSTFGVLCVGIGYFIFKTHLSGADTRALEIPYKELPLDVQMLFWGAASNCSNHGSIVKREIGFDNPKTAIQKYRKGLKLSFESDKRDKVFGRYFVFGRTSHKLKNPENSPRDWIKPLLKKYVSLPSVGDKRELFFKLGQNHFGFVCPLYMEASCLNCHGQNLNYSFRKELTKLYPKDQGVGFNLNDFSGFFWSESYTSDK